MTRLSRTEGEELLRTQREKLNPVILSDPEDKADEGPESRLSIKIRQLCKDRAWPCLIIPQMKRVLFFLPAGWPDGIIVIPLQKRIVFLELKSKTGKRSDEQRQMAYTFGLAGYPIHKVKSFARFQEIVEGREI